MLKTLRSQTVIKEAFFSLSVRSHSIKIPLRASFNQKGKRDRFKAKGLNVVTYGKETIHISGLEQLVDDSQTQGLAMMLSYVKMNC